MQLSRLVSLTDVVVLVVAAVALFLPPRAVSAGPAVKMDDDARLNLAFAEARTRAHPGDGAAVAELTRRLGDADVLDWAVQAGAVGSERVRAAKSPELWRAQLATSIAHADRLEVADALEWANLALGSCELAGETACPDWEEVRVELYQKHLDAGVKSGIDPRRNPKAFREAGEAALRNVRALGSGGPPR